MSCYPKACVLKLSHAFPCIFSPRETRMFDSLVSGNISLTSLLARAQNYRPPAGYIPTMSSRLPELSYGPGNEVNGVNRALVPFVACGDLSGLDPDTSYPLTEPVADGKPVCANGIYRSPPLQCFDSVLCILSDPSMWLFLSAFRVFHLMSTLACGVCHFAPLFVLRLELFDFSVGYAHVPILLVLQARRLFPRSQLQNRLHRRWPVLAWRPRAIHTCLPYNPQSSQRTRSTWRRGGEGLGVERRASQRRRQHLDLRILLLCK